MYSDRKEGFFPNGFKKPHLLSGKNASTPILVGFSGGADSTALLHMLCLYAKKYGCKIYAAHLNHGIRGEEADRDEGFCKSFAQLLGVTFISKKVDIPSIALSAGESTESAARRVRYEFFNDIMQEHNIEILATAHNADDNLETVIFNLARGSGLNGICGIPECRPCERGVVIRPILGMEKAEILDYCNKNQLDFVFDSTNTDTEYTRNKIRSEIIPVMKQINSGAVKNAYRTSMMLHEDSLCLESLSGWFTDELGKDFAIDTEKLCGSPISVVNRALIRIYAEVSGGKSLEATHINALHELAKKAVPHSSVSLPSNIEGIIENKKLYIRRKQNINTMVEPYIMTLFDGNNVISQTNCEIFIGNSQNAKNVYKPSILLSVQSAKIEGELVARNRESNDKILMGGMHKSIKKLMCDKKIPLEIRNRLPIICDDKGVLAVPFVGIRDGATFKETENQASAKKDIYFYLC